MSMDVVKTYGSVQQQISKPAAVQAGKNSDAVNSVSTDNAKNSIKDYSQEITRETRENALNAYGGKSKNKTVEDKDIKALSKAIEEANKKLDSANREYEFAVHEDTKKIMVKVKNKETNEVIREIPSEDILDMVAKMWEMSGILVDEKR